MAADVTSLVRVLNGYKDDQHRTVGSDSSAEKSAALITRDLLGGSASKLVNETQELDLDLQVPNGWEKRLDLKSGKVYLQRCNATHSTSVSDHNNHSNPTVPKLQDLNFPPSPSSKTPLNLFDDGSLELKLVSSPPSSSNYQSVCTLDKVKSALERAEKEPAKRRSSSIWKSSLSSSPSYSSSSSSMKETQEEEHEEKLLSSPFAAGCPGCLSYVLIMKNNPKCPRCNSVIPLPMMKKPRIDLNMTI
ncbi:protein CURLY FLAG LEAF 1 [Ziziphus jujuba]|uniref:Protein CURLY FLAG LEAF 1 n=2 Tax=Ziziphus jujuba TaxID=326968 RepID=A0A6P3YQW0_ZIZJJ|nr:protein CURLY FLAG LEAF 1 [Ziziphus jujuba]KAH7528109.1 hypothetical protein FEM48_Zijuj05G0037000 [Ziziphus jujuba var. spinosa]